LETVDYWKGLYLDAIKVGQEMLNDVRDELRKQVDTQERRAKSAENERDAYSAAHRRAELLRVWTNEDGKRFVFADELFEALEIPRV